MELPVRPSAEQRELRVFTDALRRWLGLRPLYLATPDRAPLVEQPLPITSPYRDQFSNDDWGMAQARVSMTRDEFRRLGIKRALRKKERNRLRDPIKSSL